MCGVATVQFFIVCRLRAVFYCPARRLHSVFFIYCARSNDPIPKIKNWGMNMKQSRLQRSAPTTQNGKKRNFLCVSPTKMQKDATHNLPASWTSARARRPTWQLDNSRECTNDGGGGDSSRKRQREAEKTAGGELFNIHNAFGKSAPRKKRRPALMYLRGRRPAALVAALARRLRDRAAQKQQPPRPPRPIG